MLFLEVISTDWNLVWMVTGLGFGIVLLLLCFLILVLNIFGWVMQKLNAPKAPKAAKPETKAAAPATTPSDNDKAAVAMAMNLSDNADMAAIAMALSLGSDDKAAVAYALYLYHHVQEFPTPLMPLQSRQTGWNAKAYNMNNQGF